MDINKNFTTNQKSKFSTQIIKIPDLFLDTNCHVKIDRKPHKIFKPKRFLNYKKLVHKPANLFRIKFRSNQLKEGRWERNEHEKFINACLTYGNNWKKIEEEIKTRTAAQIRSHAQKFIIKLCKKYNIKLKSKRFCGTNILNFDRKKLSPCKMSHEEKRLLDIFNYYNLEFYSNPFTIFRVHKNHTENDCPFKKNRKNKVFAIEKRKLKITTPSPQNNPIDIASSLQELINSNNQVLNFLGGNTIKMENISKYLHLNYNEDLCGIKVNLNEVYKNYQKKLQEIIFYSQYFKSFYQVPQEPVNLSKKLPSKLFSTIKASSNLILKDIVDKSTASNTESEFKIK